MAGYGGLDIQVEPPGPVSPRRNGSAKFVNYAFTCPEGKLHAEVVKLGAFVQKEHQIFQPRLSERPSYHLGAVAISKREIAEVGPTLGHFTQKLPATARC